jgi:AraC family transcriptional regulator
MNLGLNEVATLHGNNVPTENYAVVSRLTQFEQQFTGRHFGIKYVHRGTENYTLNHNKFAVNKGEYLLTSNNKEGKVCIDSKSVVEGICINLNTSLIAEAVASTIAPDTAQPDLDLDKYFGAAYFTDFKFDSSETYTGAYLQHLGGLLASHTLSSTFFDSEFYYSIAQTVVKDYSKVIQQLQQLPAARLATKKWLLVKLAEGKAYLDCNFTSELSVTEAAKYCGISQFHFFRLFKIVYGKSPWQYILQKRLLFAQHLIVENGIAIGDAALQCGFGDVFSFSKAFKKKFGYSPSKIF